MKKILKIMLVMILLFPLAGCQTASDGEESKSENPKQEEPIVEKEPEVKKTSITLSFVGDVTLGNYAGQGYSGSFDQEYEKQGKNTSYFLKKVKSIFEKDDLTIANLEGPLTNENSHAQKQFAFKGKPEYVNILKDGSIEAVTLANNHSRDRFEKGMKDTKKTLDENNVEHFGYSKSASIEVKGIKIGFLGYAFPQSFTSEMKEAVSKLKETNDLVVVYFHWGIERARSPMGSQRNIAKKTIDAELIWLLDHTHMFYKELKHIKGRKLFIV